jgi:hypothetical protein
MSHRRCLIMATFNMELRAWSGVHWEFVNVIAQIESADIVAPENRFYDKNNPSALLPLRKRVVTKLQRKLHLPVPRMVPTRVERDYDLAFYICQFPDELDELAQIKNWRRHSTKAAVFILEGWPSVFQAHARSLAKLDQFDHVFVLNGSSIPHLARYTSTPISQLSTATDAMLTTPVPRHPRRVVDICCIGRHDPETHRRLLDLSREKGLFYHYDVWKNQNVDHGWQAVRQWNAEQIRRSRYFIVWDPAHGNARHLNAEKAQVLSTRYFEGAAGGAVLLGSAPDCPEFHAAFDWIDAVIPLGENPGPAIEALDNDPHRTGVIRANNIRQSLLRHDWSHRWREVLDKLQFVPTARHIAREAELATLAQRVDLNGGSADVLTFPRTAQSRPEPVRSVD